MEQIKTEYLPRNLKTLSTAELIKTSLKTSRRLREGSGAGKGRNEKDREKDSDQVERRAEVSGIQSSGIRSSQIYRKGPGLGQEDRGQSIRGGRA